MGIDSRPASSGGGTPGITTVSNDAARLALSPTDGTAVYQKDTKELWFWTGGDYPTGAWSLFGRVNNIVFDQSTASVTMALGTNASSARTAEPVTLTANVNLSAVAPGATSIATNLDIQADGIRAQVLKSAIWGLFSVAAAPLAYNNATGQFSLPVSSDGVSGYLSGTDHTALTTVIAGLAAHIASTTAHSANHITVTPAGNISSTDVQAALVEIQGDVDTLNSANHGDVTIAAFGSSPTANGATLATQALTLQPADSTHPGALSIAAQSIGGTKSFAAAVAIGTTSAPAASTIFQVVSTTQGSLAAPVMTTTQRNAISSPTEGLRVYDSSLHQPFFYNGTNWEPERGYAVPAATTATDATTFTPGSYRQQIQLVGGASSAPASVTDVLTTNAQIGDELILVGNDSVNTVTINSGTHVTVFGSCVLGNTDSLTLVMVTSVLWLEVSRST